MVEGQRALLTPPGCENLGWEQFPTSEDIFPSQHSGVDVRYPSAPEQAQHEIL